MMKKLTILILAAVLILSMAACGKPASPAAESPDPAEEGIVGPGSVNPWVEYSSLEDVNSKIGGSLTRPAVMGVEDKYFAVMNDGECGEYRFTLNGVDYCFRFSASTAEDISGVWIEGGTVFGHDYPGETEFAETDTMKLARWINNDGQYVLTAMDNGEMDTDTFKSIVSELASMTAENPVNSGKNG